MFYEIDNGMVSLRIKAQPAASKNEFCEIYGDEAIKIRIKAPAVEGAANKELVKFLSKSFKVAKSDVVFKTGQNSKIKIVQFPLSEQFKTWAESMQSER
jgi:uncharacterized protein (TIGR00251 family)